MLKHTICHIEFGSTNLDRTILFYRSLFDWTITPTQPNYALFRSPDGIVGGFRLVDGLQPVEFPALRVEVSEFAPFVDLAARCHGGYAGFLDPLLGEWTVNLRDPDGNLIRLVRSTAEVQVSAPRAQSIPQRFAPLPEAVPSTQIVAPPIKPQPNGSGSLRRSPSEPPSERIEPKRSPNGVNGAANGIRRRTK